MAVYSVVATVQSVRAKWVVYEHRLQEKPFWQNEAKIINPARRRVVGQRLRLAFIVAMRLKSLNSREPIATER